MMSPKPTISAGVGGAPTSVSAPSRFSRPMMAL